MTKVALVTGSADRAASLRAAFEAGGVQALGLADIRATTGPVDYYVQLGVTVPVRGETVIRRVHAFLEGGLLERFATVDQVRPLLAPDASVLLVTGNTSTDLIAPDDRSARLALLRVLAHALRADMAPGKVRVRVVSGEPTDAELVEYALGGGEEPMVGPVEPPGGGMADRDYEDWRAAVLGLFTVEV
ncbi:hypothetical protein ACQEVB_24345 [Pseudonocardia sp. CA-107938]|uniref:hypothetical protein n=1 Tax=Pseudonocardia sp. CA-107938 TaxID=3240021 RepID=UPI003D8EE275